MGQLSEEKLKEVLDEHSQNLQASISHLEKMVAEIKTKFQEEQNSTLVMWLFGIAITVFALGMSLVFWGVDRGNPPIVLGGTGAIMFTVVLLVVGVFINKKPSTSKRQE